MMSSSEEPPSERRATTTNWRRIPEVGTLLGMRILAFTALFFGRTVLSAMLWFVAGYYAIVSRRARKAVREYLSRVGEKTRLRDVARLMHTFARVSVDRIFFLRGRSAAFVSKRHGSHHLAELREKREGAILLGSHLGSFEAMRGIGTNEGLKLSIVVDKVSAVRLAKILEEFAPGGGIGVIPMDEDPVSTVLRIKKAISEGQLVGILGDRRAPEDDRNVTVDFLGAPAKLPVGPYLVAHSLKCRVYQVYGLFTAPNRYDLYCEPFAESVQLERGAREASLQKYAQRFADSLAAKARQAPFNWFNFYDFWAP